MAYYKYIFANGYIVYSSKMSKSEIAVEEAKYGPLVSKTKIQEDSMLESIIAKLLFILGDQYGYDWDDLKNEGFTDYEIERCKEIKEDDSDV